VVDLDIDELIDRDPVTEAVTERLNDRDAVNEGDIDIEADVLPL